MASYCDKYTSTFGIANPCNNEIIYFTVQEMLCFSTSTNPSGKYQVRYHQTLHGEGTGSLGNKYNFSVALSGIENTNASETVIQDFEYSFAVISKGSAPNYIVKAAAHVVITPNGNTTINSYYTPECRG